LVTLLFLPDETASHLDERELGPDQEWLLLSL
jgi:hypothetical protein